MPLYTSSQSSDFSRSYVQMWVLDYKRGWVPKNRCFWVVVLEKTLESLLDCKEIKPVNPKGNQPWIFTEKTDAEAEALILWPLDAKKWLIGKDPDSGEGWGQEGKWVTADEMTGGHHWLNGCDLNKLWEMVKDWEGWCAAVYGVTKSQTRLRE